MEIEETVTHLFALRREIEKVEDERDRAVELLDKKIETARAKYQAAWDLLLEESDNPPLPDTSIYFKNDRGLFKIAWNPLHPRTPPTIAIIAESWQVIVLN